MTTLQTVLSVLMLVASLFLIVTILLQNGASQGIGAVSGGAETFFGSGKATAADKVLARVTTVIGIAFAVLAVLLNFLK